MNIIVELNRLKKYILNYSEQDNGELVNKEQINNSKLNNDTMVQGFCYPHFVPSKLISLDDRVNEFIRWYYSNMLQKGPVDIDSNMDIILLRRFIEKMASWYEERYSDDRIVSLRFKKGDSGAEIVRKNNFYRLTSFINSLNDREKSYLAKPSYYERVYYTSSTTTISLRLSNDGFIKEMEGAETLPNRRGVVEITDEILKGRHIKEYLSMLKRNGVDLPKDNVLEQVIIHYDNQVYRQEELLNCVMYRIIERGGREIGPRRALIFAKEFGRNIDIPMMYGVDYDDLHLSDFIDEYMQAGGNQDLICYEDYFSKKSDLGNISTISIMELMNKSVFEQNIFVENGSKKLKKYK